MLKRKPPKGNVRRVASIGTNSRSTIHTKNGRTVQCESFGERKLTLLFDRDPQVVSYQSQPLRFEYTDAEGKKHSYVPDFQVWKRDGSIEIHEVTLTERRTRPNIRLREEEAQKICQRNGWFYVVHTEDSLPGDTETANLLELYMFRPKAYAHPGVTRAAVEKLGDGKRLSLSLLMEEISLELDLPIGVASSGLYHLLWHGTIEADLHMLIFHDGAPLLQTLVWLPVQEGKE